MTKEDQRRMRDQTVEFCNTTVGTMLARTTESPNPVAYSAIYHAETGKRGALVIATMDPQMISLFERLLNLPSHE